MSTLPGGRPPLNRIPGGLLDFFGIKNGQWGPRTLELELAPSIDMLLWYMQTNSIYVEVPTITLATGSATGGTIDFPATTPDDLSEGGRLRVPQTEVWYIHEFVVKSIYGAGGDLGEFWPGLYENPSAINRPQPSNSSLDHSGTASFTRTAWAAMNRPIFAGPGTYVAAYTSGYTSTSNSLEIQAILKLARMRI